MNIYERNLQIESDPAAIKILKRWRDNKFPGATLEKVDDYTRQKQGIDYIVSGTYENGEQYAYNIDIKVRQAKDFVDRYWHNDPSRQDVLFEYKQGDAPYGWANDPNSKTDYVLHIFVGMTDGDIERGFLEAVSVPHQICELLTTGYRLGAMKNRYQVCPAHNGVATTYSVAIPVNRIIGEAKFYLDID